MYKAIDIAKYIINKCIDLERPITNLQLQKILYYTQGEIIKNGGVLFNETIEAWEYGPVVTEVYYSYNVYSSSPINKSQLGANIDTTIKNIIDPVIIDKSSLNVWTLVADTHNEEPWKETYEANKNNIIDLERLEVFFRQ